VIFEDEENSGNLERYDAVLELRNGGAWDYKPIRDGRIVEESPLANG
jgi:hypothetical protein